MTGVVQERWEVRPLVRDVWTMEWIFEPLREKLRQAGLDEERLRRMEADERVALLEQARLDPYDFIYLAC